MKEILSAALPKEFYTEFLDGFAENPLVGINVTDGEGRVLFLNRAHQKITGHSPELYEGRTVYDLLDEGLISSSATVEVLATGKPVLVDQESSHSAKHFQVYAVPHKGEDGVIQYVTNYLIDTTELVNLQHRIKGFSEETSSRENLLKRYMSKSFGLIYQSKAMENVIESATRIAKHDVSVLITGPSGVGKEMMSNFIHLQSEKKDGPFIKINCASIPDQLLESELFGYDPGAFTGGNSKGKKGLIESAEGGTLLLDEIGEMSMNLQAKLLRALQSRQIRHVGGIEDIDVNFRLITSTNVDLNELIEKKQFRDDLYYRISVIELHIPGLDERTEDIPVLIQYFLDAFNEKYKSNKIISADAIKYLSKCQYNGNVRELRNLVERMLLMEETDEISIDEVLSYTKRLQIDISNREEEEGNLDFGMLVSSGKSLKNLVGDYEKRLLKEYIKRYNSGAGVARALKTDQSTISRKMSKYGLT